jgi:alkylation response protein AidB-like acyl-CoA dehydrogenase
MHFRLTARQLDIKKKAREFAEAEFPPIARECDRKEAFPVEVWKKACRNGLVGVFIEEKWGGAGCGWIEYALTMEEFWRVDPGCGNLILTTFGAEVLQEFGTEEQKTRFLKPLSSGEGIMGAAITEPDAGSDIFMASTTAVKEGNEYTINGSKIFITNGIMADYVIVYCCLNPDAQGRERKYSFFIVERDREGFQATKLKGKMGIRASETTQLSFNKVRIPSENLVGQVENQGFGQVMYLFNINRVVAASQGIGVAQGAFEKALAYVQKREQFGSKLSSFQMIQFKLAEMAIRIEVGRNMVYKACWHMDQEEFNPYYISIAKTFAGEVATYVTNEAVQLHGGYGCFSDYDVERFYRDAKIVEIYEGAKEIEKITIARELLGREQ